MSTTRLAAKQRLHRHLVLLRPRLAEVGDEIPEGVRPRVVHVGVDDAGYAGLGLDIQGDLCAFCADQETADVIRGEVPGYDIRAVSAGYESLELETETADCVITTGLMAGRHEHERRSILEELFRILRVGGVMMALEMFVDAPDGGEPAHQSLSGFLRTVVVSSGGRAFVEDLESVRYPGEDLRRAGLLTVVKTGAPQRW